MSSARYMFDFGPKKKKFSDCEFANNHDCEDDDDVNSISLYINRKINFCAEIE